MKRKISLLLMLMVSVGVVMAAPKKQSNKLTPEWIAKIREIAPQKPAVMPKTARKVLLFSLFTGYNHWVTPHTREMVKVLGEESGAYEVVESNDIEMFSKDKIKQFDAVILNNNCSKGPRRNLFLDVLDKNKDLSEEDKQKRAVELEQSLLDFVAGGKGLVGIHGMITMQNESEAFGDLLGGSFDRHPKNQKIMVDIVEPEHLLVKCFEGKSFVHQDEPYLFKGAYAKKDFRPLLSMNLANLAGGSKQGAGKSDVRYISWIKKHGKGRVFYCSPSHEASSFENPKLLKFMLGGIQYSLGDLECDDSVKKY